MCGVVGIRLIDADEHDVAAVGRQLGPIQHQLGGTPDITIRFVDRLSLSRPLCFLGLDEAGYTEEGFVILRAKHKSRARVQIPFERIGAVCEIVCERGAPSIPLLIPILNLTALAKGCLPLHASAFQYNGAGILSTGWSKGGKTEMLLTFMARGARYVGDEWVYVLPNGVMCGIPEPIRVWDWHLKELPQYRARLRRSQKARLLGMSMMAHSIALGNTWRRNGHGKTGLMQRLAPLLKRQLHMDITPRELFGSEVSCTAVGIDRVFFVVSDDVNDVRVEPIGTDEVADRMVFSLQHERLDFMSYYWKFRFAFPRLRNEIVERAEGMQRALLRRVLAGKTCYVVRHPYPVSLNALFEAVSPLCSGTAAHV